MAEEDRVNLRQILDALKITKAICVDDKYSDAPEIPHVWTLYQSLSLDQIKEIPELIEFSQKADIDIRKEQFQKFWEGLETEKQKEIYSSIQSITKDEPVEKLEYLSNLAKLFMDFDFTEMSPAKWQEEKNRILSTISDREKLMILFDLDLSHSGGSFTGGISNILEVAEVENIICGILTHKFRHDDESSQWDTISEQSSLSKDKFLLISKDRLDDNIDIAQFIKMLKCAAINPIAYQMKEKVKGILQRAQKLAYEKLDKIDVRDFDYIVCTSAFEEGVWEPDMLFRIFNFYHRNAAEEQALKDKDLKNISESIREVSRFEPSLEPTPHVWHYQKEEMYKTSQYINANHLPLESGDIFQIGSKQYILLTQPCDLMIRPKDGRRKNDVTDGLLIEIVKEKIDINEAKKKFDNNPFSKAELPYLGENQNDKYLLNFRKRINTKLCILDLCVYNQDGHARFANINTCPNGLLPSLKAYYQKVIIKAMKKIVEFSTQMKNKIAEDKQKDIIKQIMAPIEIIECKGDANNFSLDFNCTRIKRLVHNRAAELLSQYSFFMSRAAFERDLGKYIVT